VWEQQDLCFFNTYFSALCVKQVAVKTIKCMTVVIKVKCLIANVCHTWIYEDSGGEGNFCTQGKFSKYARLKIFMVNKCYKVFWVIDCDNVRSDYNSPIFMSASLDDVLFLLAQCAAKGGAVNLSGQSPTSGSVPCCLTWIMVLCLSASLCPPLL
jgi:hypothetical protein